MTAKSQSVIVQIGKKRDNHGMTQSSLANDFHVSVRNKVIIGGAWFFIGQGARPFPLSFLSVAAVILSAHLLIWFRPYDDEG